MEHRGYRKMLVQAEKESLRGSFETHGDAGVRQLSRVREAYRQVSEDRERLLLQWRVLKEAWKEPFRPSQEPLRDEPKALARLNWRLAAFLMALTEVAFASWFASTYLEIPVSPAGRPLRALVLTVPVVLMAAAACLLFHKQMAAHEDERRPKKAYRRLTEVATLSSASGFSAIGTFLVTRHLLTGAQVLMAGLGIPTLGLAVGVAASLHCAEILHRPNRVAALYDASSKLAGRLERFLARIESQAEKDGAAIAEAGISQGSRGGVERCGDPKGRQPVLGAIRPDGG